ncbi:MAG: DUF1592 domain-containing protein [Verrucomicrobiota bacterium]|jgi:hypothetical protein
MKTTRLERREGTAGGKPRHVAWMAVVGAWVGALGLSMAPARAAANVEEVRPVLKEFCLGCHSTEKHKGDLDLERLLVGGEHRRDTRVWESVIEQVELGEMPPKDKPQPGEAARARLLGWCRALIDEVGLEQAGDPGPVVLRRLSNAEYTHTLRDLTGVAALDPAREFPVDGAAGEGFVNTGQSLVMSPALLDKYLDAAKQVASHLVLLPDGIRFSPHTTRRDQTEALLADIRALYRRHTDPRGADRVNLQGIVLDTNAGGRLPVEAYLRVWIENRASSAPKSIPELARAHGLSARYLATLSAALAGDDPSLLLAPLRDRMGSAKGDDVPALSQWIAGWQKALWKFSPVGHIGKKGGPSAWMEPVQPVVARQELRLKLPENPTHPEVVVYLATGDAGDGARGDVARWRRPRLVAPGRPDLLLRDLRGAVASAEALRTRLRRATVPALMAADLMDRGVETNALAAARKAGVAMEDLSPWLGYLGIGASGPLHLTGHLTQRIAAVGGHDFVRALGFHETPSVTANASDKAVRVPGDMTARSVALHPSPTLNIGAGWRAPVGGVFQLSGTVRHAHPECGNGVTWSLELRRGPTRHRLASGVAQGGKEGVLGPLTNLVVRPGDLVSVVIGARDGNHSCDLTRVELRLADVADPARAWDLAKEVSGDLWAGNPHADAAGRPDVWHFYTELAGPTGDLAAPIPPGSVLDRWMASDAAGRAALAPEVARLLANGPAAGAPDADVRLHRLLTSLGGPLLAGGLQAPGREGAPGGDWGLEGSRFDGEDLLVRGAGTEAVRIPADVAAGREWVVSVEPDAKEGAEATLQATVGLERTKRAAGAWPDVPFIVGDGTAARARVEAGLARFRDLFPAALCYEKIVPVDEVVTLTLFHREDEALRRLVLDDEERARLDRLWDELHFVSQDALTLVDAFEQLWQYATQDGDPSLFEPMRGPIQQRAAAFRARQVEAEPRHVAALLEWAARAYRRPLKDDEAAGLRALHAKLRAEDIPHDDAVRLMLARVLVSPAFLYRAEEPGPGKVPVPVSGWEMASRLSYFLWSSAPDDALLKEAADGRLATPEGVAAATRRMVQDDRVRRWANEFGAAWLHVQDVAALDEKSERHFPEFAGIRADLQEEVVRTFEDLMRHNRPVTDLLDSDTAIVSEALAKFYGIPGVTGPGWHRVSGVKAHGRGGVLAMGAVLAKQSGASRTSPILRGNWLCEVLLGDKLPKPPKGVPPLPEDESATEGLTVRQVVERHSQDPRCSGCHVRIDPFGHAMEAYDAIGRRRERDMGGRLLDTRVTLPGGVVVEGMDGLRAYLAGRRREAFVRQFCRKLAGYALGRSIQVSDGPMLKDMAAALAADGMRVHAALEVLVRSKAFREIRGRDVAWSP